MLSEHTQFKNVQAIVDFLFYKINHGGGNGHFTVNADVNYYRNGILINTFHGLGVHFENSYENRVFIPELASLDSPRIRADFSSFNEIIKFDGTKLTITGGRTSNVGFGRFMLEII